MRFFSSIAMARCCIAGSRCSVPTEPAISTRTGWRNMLAAKGCSESSKVADNHRFCLLLGSSANTRFSSSMKPKSSKRSTSSKTRCATLSSCSALWSTKSNKRPGVATTISAPPRNASICGLMDTPPNTVATRRAFDGLWCCVFSSTSFADLDARTSSLNTCPTCTANSRVGTMTKTRALLRVECGAAFFRAGIWGSLSELDALDCDVCNTCSACNTCSNPKP